MSCLKHYFARNSFVRWLEEVEEENKVPWKLINTVTKRPKEFGHINGWAFCQVAKNKWL